MHGLSRLGGSLRGLSLSGGWGRCSLLRCGFLGLLQLLGRAENVLTRIGQTVLDTFNVILKAR